MIRGADKEIRDSKGQRPIDLVNGGEVETQGLANDLRKMLVSLLCGIGICWFFVFICLFVFTVFLG